MSFFTLRRLLTAGLREGFIWFGATAGERLARRFVDIPTTKRRAKRKTKRKTK